MAASAGINTASFPYVISNKNIEVQLKKGGSNQIICEVFDKATLQRRERFLNNFEKRIITQSPIEKIEIEQIVLQTGATNLSERSFPMVIITHKDHKQIQNWHNKDYHKIDVRLIETEKNRYSWIVSNAFSNQSIEIEAGPEINEKTIPSLKKEHSLEIVSTPKGPSVNFCPYLYSWSVKEGQCDQTRMLMRNGDNLYYLDKYPSGEKTSPIKQKDEENIDQNILRRRTQHLIFHENRLSMANCYYKWSLDDGSEFDLVGTDDDQKFKMTLPNAKTRIVKLNSLGAKCIKALLRAKTDLSFDIVFEKRLVLGEFKDCLHKWQLMDGSEIKLLIDNELKCEILFHNKSISVPLGYRDWQRPSDSRNFDRADLCIEDYYLQLRKRHPVYLSREEGIRASFSRNKTLKFVDHVSQLDDQKEMAPGYVAITLVNGAGKEKSNPTSWAGHASIRLELFWDDSKYLQAIRNEHMVLPLKKKISKLEKELTEIKKTDQKAIDYIKDKIGKCNKHLEYALSIKAGDRVMMKCHIADLDRKDAKFFDKGEVYIEFVEHFDLSQISGKTITWIDPFEEIKPLFDFVISSKEFITFDISGKPFFWDLLGAQLSPKKNYNCITWAKEALKAVSINIPLTSNLRELQQIAVITPGDYIPKIPRLHLAAVKGNLDDIERLLKEGANINEKDKGMTPLAAAIDAKQVDAALLLIKMGADVTSIDRDRSTALHKAALSGLKKVVEQLIEKVKVNSVDYYGRTPLHLAAANGHTDTARQLIKFGSNVNAVDKINQSPLHVAIFQGHLDIVRLLVVDNKADIDLIDKISGYNALHLAANQGYSMHQSLVNFNIKERYFNIASILLDRKTDVNVQGKIYMKTPLHLAADNGNIRVVRLLLENKADTDIKDQDKESALHFAARKGHEDIVRLLVERGAKIDDEQENGFTPLHLAAVNGAHGDIAKFLIENGSKINLSTVRFLANRFGKDAMYWALEMGKDIFASSPAKMREKELKNELHKNALILAALIGHEAVIKFLEIKKEATLTDPLSKTPIIWEENKNQQEMIKFLFGIGADLNSVNKKGRTILHLAAEIGNKAFAEFLLENGSDKNIKDEKGKTALDIATENGHSNFVKSLK